MLDGPAQENIQWDAHHHYQCLHLTLKPEIYWPELVCLETRLQTFTRCVLQHNATAHVIELTLSQLVGLSEEMGREQALHLHPCVTLSSLSTERTPFITLTQGLKVSVA